MKHNKKQRGFTLIELVIVIAVVAILAAVLIPTFADLIQKAKRSNDIGIVQQANTLLTANEAVEGKNKTFSEARADLLGDGLDIGTIKASAENHKLAWDRVADRLVLLDGEEIIVAPDDYNDNGIKNLFVVAESADEVEAGTSYNYYLPDGFAVTDNTLRTAVGIDVGNNVNINISYTSSESETRMFNTNGGTLTLNNASANIDHYGSAARVDIEAVAKESYHCYAKVDSIDVIAGRVVVESGADVPVINVNGNDAEIKVNNEENDLRVIVGSNVTGLPDDAIPDTVEKVDLSEFGSNVVAISNYKAGESDEGIYTYTADEFKGTNSPLSGANTISNGTTEITLLGNVTVNTKISVGKGESVGTRDIVLNLNGCTLTTETTGHFDIGYECDYPVSFTIKNGTIDHMSSDDGVRMYKDGTIIFEDVTFDFNSTQNKAPIIFDGRDEVNINNAKAIIRNSTITGYNWCISTNATSSKNWDIAIEIENSDLIVKSKVGTAIMLNVPGTLDAKNSTISGNYQAAYIRAGNATFTNCTLTHGRLDEADADKYENAAWGGGNWANLAALTIGNKSEAAAYQNPVNVTLTGCTLTTKNLAFPALYAWANNEQGKGVTLNYTDCTFNGDIVLGGTAPTKWIDGSRGPQDLSDTQETYFADNYGLTHMWVNGMNYAGKTGPITLNP